MQFNLVAYSSTYLNNVYNLCKLVKQEHKNATKTEQRFRDRNMGKTNGSNKNGVPDFHHDFVAPKKVKDVKEAIDFVQELKSDPDFKNAKKAIKHVTLTTMR